MSPKISAHSPFVCMLACYVEWRMREAWRELMFADPDQSTRATRGFSGGTSAKKHKLSEQTIYAWRKHFGELAPVDVKRLRALDGENSRLKKLLAERDLDIEVFKEINRTWCCFARCTRVLTRHFGRVPSHDAAAAC